MKELSEMYGIKEIDELIEQILRNDASVLAVATSGRYTAEERAKSPRLNALCNALERRAELTNHTFK